VRELQNRGIKFDKNNSSKEVSVQAHDGFEQSPTLWARRAKRASPV